MNRVNAPSRTAFRQHEQLDARAVDLAALESSCRFTGRCRPSNITVLSDYQRRTLCFCRTNERDVFGQMLALVFCAHLRFSAFKNQCVWREQRESCGTIAESQSAVETFNRSCDLCCVIGMGLRD